MISGWLKICMFSDTISQMQTKSQNWWLDKFILWLFTPHRNDFLVCLRTYLNTARMFLMWAQASFSAVIPSLSTAKMSMSGWHSNSWITLCRWLILLKCLHLFRNIYLSVVQQSTKAHKNCSVCTSIEKVILANFLGTIDRIVSKFNLHNKKYSKTLPTSFHLIQDKNVQIENVKNHILYNAPMLLYKKW